MEANWWIVWKMAGKFKSRPPMERTRMEQGRVEVWCKALRREEVGISEGKWGEMGKPPRESTTLREMRREAGRTPGHCGCVLPRI